MKLKSEIPNEGFKFRVGEVRNMRTRHAVLIAMGLLVVWNIAPMVCAQDKVPLKLVQTIPLPGVKGRMDHLGVDLKGKRLFAAALDNNTLEVIDLKEGKRIFSIPGQSKPQGVFYSPDFNTLFVDNGGDGTCKIYTGDTFKLIDSLPLGEDADHVGYDPATKYLYAGYGSTKSGALGIIDTHTNKHIGDIKTEGRPGGIKIEESTPRIFLRFAGTANLAVVDRAKREVITTWPVTEVKRSNSLALDETHHRLFDGTNGPGTLIVFDTESGKQIAQLEGIEGTDDTWYDAARKRIYISGGRGAEVGFAYVYQQKDADNYELIAKVPTRANAGTSIWVPEFNRYFVSAAAHGGQDAAILVFEPQP
jgi:DNA-binding beta-propeller fold protein YncE